MALTSTRMEYRVALAHVERGVEAQRSCIVARHPSETAEHLTLRVLAFCLLYEEALEFGAGLSDGEAADLWTRDPTGEVTTWVECGTARLDKLRKVAQRHGRAAVHAVFSNPRRRDELLDEIAADQKTRKGLDRVSLWTVDAELVATLAAREERRQRWTVTVVGDHLYVDADGATCDGAVLREKPGV